MQKRRYFAIALRHLLPIETRKRMKAQSKLTLIESSDDDQKIEKENSSPSEGSELEDKPITFDPESGFTLNNSNYPFMQKEIISARQESPDPPAVGVSVVD